MMFAVGSDAVNTQLTWLAGAIVVLAFISIVQWGQERRPGRMLTNLPLAALPLYVIYEWAMPNSFDIRVDLLVVWPALGFIIFMWLKKTGRLERNKSP